MRKQSFTFTFEAPPDVVYRAMMDPQLLPKWRVPDNMTMEIHEFVPKESGRFRISLTYEDLDSRGKSSTNTDTYKGYFKTLVPNKKIVEVIEFETANSAFQGEMIISTNLSPKGRGTELVALHENLPNAIPEDQNEAGWKMSLGKLAQLIQTSS